MPATSLTPDGDAVIGEILIAAPPERIFEALTDPTQLMQWWGQQGYVPFEALEHGPSRRRRVARRSRNAWFYVLDQG